VKRASSLLPILGKLLADRQPALDHSTTRRCRRECARPSAALPSRVRPACVVGPPIGTIGAMGRTFGRAGSAGFSARGGRMMQGVREVHAGPSGTATPACGARGGRPLLAPFARRAIVRAE